MDIIKRDDSEGIPKYIQLSKILKEKIASGEYHADSPIPTEKDLCSQYQVSRITVRQAINTLVQEKLLYREQGRGTYIQPQKLKRDITNIYSFTNDMLKLGLRPGSILMEQKIVDAEPEAAERLKLPPKDCRVLRVVRLRLANEIPVIYETTLIPRFLCPQLVKEDLAKGSLYQILGEKYKLVPRHAEESYEAIVMSESQAQLLQCSSTRHQPALSIQRIAFLEDMTPLEFTTSVGRGDRLTFSIKMAADNANFQRRIDL
jgi:GntR family transcriptional regulator